MLKFAFTTVKMMNNKNRNLDIVFAAGVLVIAWVMLFYKASYRLQFKEQISIFLLGADRIEWYLSNPGVVASVLGDWLTQFYLNRLAGTTLSVLLLAAIMTGVARFFRLAEPQKPVCLIMSVVPVLLEGYFITFPNYPLSATVGLALSVWAACLMVHIKDSGLSAWIIGLSVPVVFVIAGGHALTFALMLAFLKRKDGIMPLLSIAVGIVLMLICGRMYNLTFVHSLIWPVWPGYIIPDKALLLLMPWMISATFVLSLHYSKVMDSTWKPVVLSLLALSGTPISSVLSLDELERTVKIGTLAYQNKWEEVREMSSSDKPSIYNAYYWNVCNAREGRLADELLNGRWGRSSDVLFLSTKRGDPYFSMMYYTDALLEMGDVSQATDCALLAQTVMPGHYSSRMLRRLAEIAVVTADYGVASKYLDILLHTRNHKAWAADLLAHIEARDIPEQYLTWRSRTAGSDRFFAQGDSRSSLTAIADFSPYNRVAIDYLLCSYLLDKNINTFLNLYNRYYYNGLDRIVTVPDLYQEALLVNVDSRESFSETVSKYNISREIADKYIRLMDARSKDPHPEAVITKEAMGTYWHYIMAVRFNN